MISQVLMLLIVFVILTMIFYGIYVSKIKDAGKKKWGLILYLIVTGVLFGLIGSLGFIEFIKLPLWIFIIAQIWILLIGILHAWLFEMIIPLENKNLGNIIFTMTIFFFGYSLVLLAYRYYFEDAFPWIYLMPGFFFIVPVFVIIAFNNFIKIPLKVYKAWDFPAPGTLPDPNDQEMNEPIIINFEIRKQCEDNRTIFKAKAPKFMELGKLYYFFVGDYNARHPNNSILLTDNKKRRFKWVFYQPGNLLLGKFHLDPEITISENRIKENMSIICERISL